MSKNQKLIDGTKRIVLHTSTINSYGFRMLTSGGDLRRFYKNPIMLAYHNRGGQNWQANPTHPIGIWKNIKLEGDVISALPAFYEGNDYAMEIYGMYEAGILCMASMGARPIEESTEPQHLLPGQTRATVIRWEAMEASITDIGSNPDALTIDDKRIELSDDNIETYLPKILNTKKMLKLTAQAMVLLALTENYTEAQVNDAILKLHADLDGETTKRKQLEKDKETLVEEKEALEVKLTTQKNTAMVQAAKDAGKITDKQVPYYMELAASNPETTEKLLNEIPARTGIVGQLNTETPTDSADKAMLELSWDALDKNGQLPLLKEKYPDVFAAKQKEAFPNMK